ncbi:MAG: FAD:protein FMN transferase, partial [Planctomycetota bacterium]
MDRRIGRMATILVCVLLGGLSYFSCAGKEPVKADSGHQLVMGTFARVVVVAENQGVGKECIQAALTEIHKVDELMSDYRSESEISKVNKEAFDHAVEVSESTYEVLQRSVDFSELTAGAFDITVGPLMDLFHNAEKDDAAPTKDQIAEAKSKVGFEKLKLDRQSKTVRFAVKGMRLDLGGIAKGYAIDKAIEAARRGGATGAMIDIGGDIRCFGSPPKGREHWLIGVQDPNSATKGIGGGKLL